MWKVTLERKIHWQRGWRVVRGNIVFQVPPGSRQENSSHIAGEDIWTPLYPLSVLWSNNPLVLPWKENAVKDRLEIVRDEKNARQIEKRQNMWLSSFYWGGGGRKNEKEQTPPDSWQEITYSVYRITADKRKGLLKFTLPYRFLLFAFLPFMSDFFAQKQTSGQVCRRSAQTTKPKNDKT